MLKTPTGFSLLLIGKCKRKEINKEGLLNIKKPGIDGFRHSQPLQMANNSKIKKWLPHKEQTNSIAQRNGQTIKLRV